ncbi:MAG TPA: ankyrin repeat domain-containing protein [Kofleriaceae bacterium]|nr:ankyrin repeat domain-containing protein [Kofleriaceae bacterium]
MALRPIGFWRAGPEPDESGLPHPREVIDDGWSPAERARVVRYLRRGHPIAAYLGYSHCRLECGIPWHFMGSRDLSDGTWVWPEGYAHYVEHHGVRPPPEVLADIAGRLPWLPPWWRLRAAWGRLVQRRRLAAARRAALAEARLPPQTTPLHEAAQAGDVAALERALEAQPVDQRNRIGETALHVAARSGAAGAVRALLARGASVEGGGGGGSGGASDADGAHETPLAMARGHAVAALLVEAGARVDPEPAAASTPLTHACGIGDLAQVQLLLDRGARIDRADRFRTPLEAAASRAVVELLLERGADPRAGDLLVGPIRRGEVDLVARLIDLGAAADRAGSRRQTPLFYAAQAPAGDAAVGLLLERGARPDAANDLGDTPLHMACGRTSIPAVERLLAAGASVRTRSQRGMTPLHWAALATERPDDSAAVIERLLAAGAGPIDARDQWGRTPLFMVVARGDAAAARALLAAGARPDVANEDGVTPRQLAAERADPALRELLG